jgi:phosphopantothenoylcysteine decarboxylase / phosphopantothenate---cysteine ligase
MTNPLNERKIILGVTGSIAAYKSADLASKLTQVGAIVDVILTESAQKFVNPLTYQSVTSRKVYTDDDLWRGESNIAHVKLGQFAELMVIAPATANTIARLAAGLADNLLSITALAARCPLVVAPAMDVGMYAHSSVQENVKKLSDMGVVFIGPEEGHLASGLKGVGRMTSPGEIIGYLRILLGTDGPLKGMRVVVTAGGTQEAIDPVRILTNRSTGRQGYAIAQAALDAGAEVDLVTAPTHIDPPFGANLVHVESTGQMHQAVISLMTGCDMLVMAAAPVDFRPANPNQTKIKKGHGAEQMVFEPTTDILSKVAEYKQERGFPRYTVGFAAESHDLIENAKQKLSNKKLDMIVANDITQPGVGFKSEKNQVSLIIPDGSVQKYPMIDKYKVGEIIIERFLGWNGG